MSESKTYDDGLKFALEAMTTEMIGALKGIVETPGTDPTPQILPRIVAGLVAERLRYAKAESEAPAPVGKVFTESELLAGKWNNHDHRA